MELDDFLKLVPRFTSLSDTEQVKHFAWYLHRHRRHDSFSTASIRACYSEAVIQEPNVGREISRLQERHQILKVGDGYRLEKTERDVLDKKYGDEAQTVAISQLLRSLPGKISDSNEQTFLDEVLKCYQAAAFRASTVMTWNLAYDHLLGWILANPKRLATFNSCVIGRVGAKRAIAVVQREDFNDLKEAETLDIAGSAKLIDKGMKQVLDFGLTRRNQAAHPSTVAISRATAEDMIDSLVTNIVLKLGPNGGDTFG